MTSNFFVENLQFNPGEKLQFHSGVDIDTSITLEEAERELVSLSEKWNSKYSSIRKMWERNWENLITIFDYPNEIRKIIYTTNAIESLNSVI